MRWPFDNLSLPFPAAALDAPKTMTTELLRTPLHDWHVKHGGRMVDFAGWSMPVQYSSIAEEHNATRNAVGVFDISHMGRFDLGGETDTLFERVLTRRFADMRPNQIRYSLICNESGGIQDDVLVYRGDDDDSVDLMVVNASNREKIAEWLRKQIRWLLGYSG